LLLAGAEPGDPVVDVLVVFFQQSDPIGGGVLCTSVSVNRRRPPAVRPMGASSPIFS
jgi:hypothetical protein